MTHDKRPDSLYASPRERVAEFAFDENVASVFDDMIHRSLPGYGTVVSLIGVLAGQYVQPGTVCYDLGCSLGTTTLSMRRTIPPKSRIVAVDYSMEMLKRCASHIALDDSKAPVHLLCGDIRTIPVREASLVVLNFVLQFVPPQERLQILKNIYKGMLPGSALIVSEKISFEENGEQAIMTDLHHLFKKHNGYSDLEISQKRTALENVLVSETVAKHKERFFNVGFTSCYEWFQCFNFVSLLALK